jgi:hypothetical protein
MSLVQFSTRSNQTLNNRYRDPRALHKRKFLHTKQISRRRNTDCLLTRLNGFQAQAERGTQHVLLVLDLFHDGAEKCFDSGG